MAGVIDGDTVRVRIGRETKTVRLLGIDAPESKKPGRKVECGSRQAARYLRGLLIGKRGRGRTVTLTSDPSQGSRDRYNRTLAYVSARGDINRKMIASGWADFYPNDHTPFARTATYEASAKTAKAKRRGVWKVCSGDFHRLA